MADPESIESAIRKDIWTWLNGFVTVPHEFYKRKFAPCPFALPAIVDRAVDVTVWLSGDVKSYIREKAIELRDAETLSTRVMAFPPRVQWQWGISEFVESVNEELIPHDVFINTGVTKTMNSRYPGSAANAPYFIVVANRLEAVLSGSDTLQRTGYYKDWPGEQYELVVERRARMARLFRRK